MRLHPIPTTLLLCALPVFAQGVDPMESVAGWKPYNPTVEGRLATKDGELLVTIPYTDGKRDTYVLYKNLSVDLKPGAVLVFPAFIPKKSFLSLEVYVDEKGQRIFSYRPGQDKVETIEVPVDGAKLTKLTFSFSEPADQTDTGTEERTFRIGAIKLKGSGNAAPLSAPSGTGAASTAATMPSGATLFVPSPKPIPGKLPGPNLFPEGDFEKLKKDFAEGWVMGGFCWDSHRPNRVSLETENGRRFARLHSGLNMEKAAVWVIADPIPLLPDWKNVKAAVTSRVANFKKGPEGWHGLRIEATWRDAMNREMKGSKGYLLPEEPVWKESLADFPVPAGAAMIQFKIGFWSGMGTADIDDLRVAGE